MQQLGNVGEVFRIVGILKPDDLLTPAGTIGDSQMDAANPIAADKALHQHNASFQQVHGSAATTERHVIHHAYADGTLAAFEAGIVVANAGAATITIDLLKNGSTVLSGVITLNSTGGTGGTAYDIVAAAISSASYVQGDVFEVNITATAGGGTLGQGLFGSGVFRENAGA